MISFQLNSLNTVQSINSVFDDLDGPKNKVVTAFYLVRTLKVCCLENLSIRRVCLSMAIFGIKRKLGQGLGRIDSVTIAVLFAK